MRPVYAEAKTAGTIADAVMRDALTRSLGVEWGPVANGIAELVAVPDRRCASTSRPRHAEIIEEATRARAHLGARGIAAIQRETRDRKRVVSRERGGRPTGAPAPPSTASARAELARALGRARAVDCRPTYAERLRAQAGADARARRASPAQRSTFTRREVIQALAEAHPEGAPRRASSSAWPTTSSRARCVALARRRRRRRAAATSEALFTTPDMLRTEVRLLDDGHRARPARRRSSPTPRRSRRRSPRGRRLGADQAARGAPSRARARPACGSWRRAPARARPSPWRRCARPTSAPASR